MIGLFKPKTTKADLIKYNGDWILNNICVKAYETEEFNDYGMDYIFLVSPECKEVYDNIVVGAWIKQNCEYGIEYYEIAQVTKNKRNIQVYARHATISELLNLWCEDVRPTNLNGQASINWIYDNSIGLKKLNVSSDITTLSTAYYVNMNMYQALYDSDNSFIDRWGGESERRGFTLKLNSKIGEDRGVSIRSRKNLIGLEESTNLNKLATRIYPKGYDGITITEKYIDSPIINNYAKVYTREVKFDDVRVNDENYSEGFATLADAQEELKKRVKKMYEVDKIDVVTADYRIDFVELERTEEYKDYSVLERTWLGDTVEVIDETLDVNIKVRVVKRIYDCLRRMRVATELSNKDLKEKPPSINDVINEISNIPSQDDTLQKAKDNATNLINAGLKDSYVVVKQDEILIMNTKDINTATKIWRWNNGALGYSNTGYFGTFGTAITSEGAIVADFITTGILNANLIKAGVIRGFNNNVVINLETGEVSFKKGIIEGLNSSWNLNTGVFETRFATESGIYDVEIGKGMIRSDNHLSIRSLKSLVANLYRDGRTNGIGLYDWGNSFTCLPEQKINIGGGTTNITGLVNLGNVNKSVTAKGDMYVDGTLYANVRPRTFANTDTPSYSQIATHEEIKELQRQINELKAKI